MSNFRDTTPLEKLIARIECEGGEQMVVKAYALGLSRGLELAKEHATVAQAGDFDPPLYVIDFSRADEAVAREAGK